MISLTNRIKLGSKLKIRALLGSILKRANGPHTYALIAKTPTGLFAVDPEDQVVGRQLRNSGTYGTTEIEKLLRTLTPQSRALIIGAHVGTIAIPLSRYCREVVAIEANPSTFALLRHNIALNEIPNCRALNIAASDKRETLQFLLSRANSGGSKRVPKTSSYAYYYDKPEQVTVEAFSLDEQLADDRRFDVVLMDIEGSEYFALRGMQSILSHAAVLVVEFIPHHLRNVSGVTVEDFLLPIGCHFDCLTIPSKNLQVGSSGFLSTLQNLFDADAGDDGIVFEKRGRADPRLVAGRWLGGASQRQTAVEIHPAGPAHPCSTI